jgi:hypothetical protein
MRRNSDKLLVIQIVRGYAGIRNREVILQKMVPFQVDEHRERRIEESRHFSPKQAAQMQPRAMLGLSA